MKSRLKLKVKEYYVPKYVLWSQLGVQVSFYQQILLKNMGTIKYIIKIEAICYNIYFCPPLSTNANSSATCCGGNIVYIADCVYVDLFVC